MAEKSSFFDSVNADRVYFAADWASHMAEYFSNGIFNNGLKVVANNDMSISIQLGAANINGYKYKLDTNPKIINVGNADGILNRIDNIVIRLDIPNRQVTAEIVQGNFGENAVAPALIRGASIYDLRIAKISVPAGTTAITQDLITDCRFDNNDCGNVVCAVQNPNFTDILNQYEAIWDSLIIEKTQNFNAWFKEMKDQLSEDAAGKIQTQLNDLSKTYKGTNIIADTVAGFGRVDTIYGDITETGTGDKSPTNPYEIKCVGDDINIAQHIAGYLQNGVFKSDTDDSFVFRVKKGETYIFSGEGNRSHSAIFSSYPVNNAVCIEGTYSQTLTRNTPFIASETGYMVIYANTPTNPVVIHSFKAQKGSIATAYSKYGEGTIEIISKNDSNTSSNIIYKGKPLYALKDTDGEFMARDCTEGTKVYRNCMSETFDGSDDENWVKVLTDINAYTIPLKYPPKRTNTTAPYTCTHFKAIAHDDRYQDNTFFLNDTHFSLEYNSKTTLESFKAWLKANPITIVYELLTPITEDINGSNKIVQYDESTTIYNRDSAELEVTLTNNKAVSDVYGDLKNVEENVSSLQTIENWKTLTDGIKYRKKGNDVEVWMNYLVAVTVPALNHSQVIAQLPNGYRPDIEIAIPIFVRSRTGPIYPELYLTILADGGIYFNNGSSNQIVADVFKAFVKY